MSLNKKKLLVIFPIFLTSMFGCKKLIEVGTPPNQLTTSTVFSDSSTATAALLNGYAQFDKAIDPNYTPFIGIYAGELSYTAGNIGTLEFLHGAISASNSTVQAIWQNMYAAIYQCNDLIGNLKVSSGVTHSASAQLIGEAKFLRAYAYFYLTNSFGPVPLVLTTDTKSNSLLSNADSASIYRQIVGDLQEAIVALPETYIGDGKVRANKWAATALLARVHLYQRDWADAGDLAGTVINSGNYTPLDSAQNVFLAGSTESILQFWTQYGYTSEGLSFIPDGSVPNYPISSYLLDAFETGDLRLLYWTDSVSFGKTTYYYPFKYHNRSPNSTNVEYLMGLRLSEQYLIRAEARAYQNDIPGAIADINTLRFRAGLPQTSAVDQSSVLDAIAHERQTELFLEWGHRFLDLKRMGMLDEYMLQIRPDWKVGISVLLPIPQSEISYDPKLKQNPGY